MTKLIEFMKEHESELSDCEKDILTAGLYVVRRFQDEALKELEVKPRQEITLDHIMTCLDYGIALLNKGDRGSKEKDSGDLLVLLWDELMPGYSSPEREVTIKGVGRADILTSDEDGVRTVIELKCASPNNEKGAHEQASRYARALELSTGKPHNTLVINSSGVCSDEGEVITWTDLGIFNDHAYAPDYFDISDLAAICDDHNVYPKQHYGRYAYPYKVLWDYIHGEV